MTDLAAIAAAHPPCTEVDVDVFFPRDAPSSQRAKAICADCHVRDQCLEYALAVPQYGIWGGTNADERAALVRKQDGSYNLNWTPKVAGPPPSRETARRRELRAGATPKVGYRGPGGHQRLLADVLEALDQRLSRGQIAEHLGIHEKTLAEVLSELDRQRAAS